MVNEGRVQVLFLALWLADYLWRNTQRQLTGAYPLGHQIYRRPESQKIAVQTESGDLAFGNGGYY